MNNQYTEKERLAEAIEVIEGLLICPAFNGELFEKDKESHIAWTLARQFVINEALNNE